VSVPFSSIEVVGEAVLVTAISDPATVTMSVEELFVSLDSVTTLLGSTEAVLDKLAAEEGVTGIATFRLPPDSRKETVAPLAIQESVLLLMEH
jgi:hypothetical protein